MAAAHSLVGWLRRNAEGLPLVVNTPGWVKVTCLPADTHSSKKHPRWNTGQHVCSCFSLCSQGQASRV